MLPSQVLQGVIEDLAGIAGISCSVWSIQAEGLSFSDPEGAGHKELVEAFLKKQIKQDVDPDRKEALFLVCAQDQPKYVFLVAQNQGAPSDIEMIGRLGVSQLERLIKAYQVRLDHGQVIQDALLGKTSVVELYNQARKMRIPKEMPRVVFVIEAHQEQDQIVLEMIRGLYTAAAGDFVTALGENHVILVKALTDTEPYQAAAQVAADLIDILNTEAMVRVRVAYGTAVNELKAIRRSYEEAQIALDVGRVFYAERNILAYRELGIGRLIHQLPGGLCQMFLTEVLGGTAEAQFSEEVMVTVNQFFDNNLNISETARQLYLHRNTLMYRLEKVHQQTGLDVRIFDDAVTFKIAMMVSKHIQETSETKEERYD